MKLLSWNCRGTGKPSFASGLSRIIKTSDPDIICLQETKSSAPIRFKIKNLLGRNWECASAPASGSAGGIAFRLHPLAF